MFFKIAPDSMLASNKWRVGSGNLSRYVPLLSLLWMFWLFAPFVFDVGVGYHTWFWPTIASVPVFLALYASGYLGPRRRIAWHAFGICLLGCALTPVNPYAETYLIYACAVAAFGNSSRQSIQVIAAMMVIYSAEWLLLRYPWMYLANALIISLIVGVMGVYQRIQRERQAELRLTHDEIRRLAATAERERIGRDLHDLLGHTLSLVTVKSELAGRLFERDPVAARREIADVERVAREALSQVRNAVTGIRAAALISELASARLLLESAGVACDYRNACTDLPAEIETCLALVLREAVTNIQRHARATRTDIFVARERDHAVMRVHDDGRGGIGGHGNGLTGMRERIEMLGGSLSIRSERGHGTELTIVLPLPAETPSKPVRDAAPAAQVSLLKHA